MDKKCGELFFTFMKIGAFTFGGGYAMIPLIQREVVEQRQWVSDEDILDVIAIAESTPGPIAINAATFIGQKLAGVKGAFCATAGVCLPSFVIILAVSFVLQAFQQLKVVQYAFWGIRAGILALILKAMWSMFGQCKRDWFAWGIMGVAFVGVTILKWNAILVLLICGGCGLLGYICGYGKAENRLQAEQTEDAECAETEQAETEDV